MCKNLWHENNLYHTHTHTYAYIYMGQWRDTYIFCPIAFYPLQIGLNA